MRLLTLAWYFIHYAIPFLLIMPDNPMKSTLSLMILQEFEDLRKYTREVRLTHSGGESLAITNAITPERSVSDIVNVLEPSELSIYPPAEP